jgi:hypothetical protein
VELMTGHRVPRAQVAAAMLAAGLAELAARSAHS